MLARLFALLRTALRHEMLLTLIRLLNNDRQAVEMEYTKLRDLRKERLAHQQIVTKVRVTGATAIDREIEHFDKDN